MRACLLFLVACLGCGRSAPVPEGTASAAAAPAPQSPADPLVGRPAPDFTAPASDGSTVHLAALRGHKVILYFYPKDETPGCTAEAAGFRDAFDSIAAKNAVVVGVSRDGLDSHRAFSERLHLPFALVSDADGAIARRYSVPLNGSALARQTIVIGEDGNVLRVYRRVDAREHPSELLADLAR